MKLVRISDLLEEEKKKAFEEQQDRINRNIQESQNARNQANNDFNNLISKKGAYYTNKHTTTIRDIEKAYRGKASYNTVKQSLNEYYKSNKSSLWEEIKNIASNSSRMILGDKASNRLERQSINKDYELEASKQAKTYNMIYKTQMQNKSYQKSLDEQLKNTLSYKQAQKQNPNASEGDILKNVKSNNNEKIDLLEEIALKNGAERTQILRKLSNGNEEKYRELNNKVLQYKISMEANESTEKINEDLKNGKIGSSIEHVLTALPEKTLEAVASPIYSTGSLLNLKLPTGTADQDLKDWKTISSKYDQTTSNIDNNVVKTASNVSGTLGYMVPSILTSLIAPGTNAGRIAQGVSVAGEGYSETLNDNASNKLKALLTGAGKGYASYSIEGVTGGNILGKGSLDDLAVKTIASKTANPISKKIASTIYEVGGEVFEEELENQVDYLIDKVVNNKGISLKDWLSEQQETVKDTILSTMVLKMLGLGGDTYNDVKNYEDNTETNKWISEADKIIKKENLKIDVEKLKNNQLEVKNVLNTLKKEEALNLQSKYIQTQETPQTQQTIQKINKMPQNINVEEENRGVAQNYAYEESENSKINNLRQDASKYWDNSEKTKNLMNTIEKVVGEKNYNVRLDENITNNKGQSVNAQIKTLDNGDVEIKINPNSKNVGEFLITHEITHAIETNEMKQLVMDYASKNTEFSNALDNLKQTYGVEDVSSEVIADISGKLFGNQEFINNLSVQKPNVFKKIYNKIVEFANKITGNSKEGLFVRDLKNKWEEAYRIQNNNLGNNAKYSFAGEKGINNAMNEDIQNIELERRLNKAKQMKKINVDNETIRQQTNWFQDKNGDWKFEFSDKDMSIKRNIKLKADNSYKLGDILEHDTLFTLYPELEELQVKFNDIKKANGNYNRNKNIITINNTLLGSNSKIEGTIIHEIQHAIQNIEGFEGGSSTKKSRQKYYNSLGEIEADNVKKRFIDEKYKNKNVRGIAPESSKSNPKHRNYDNYMKNRTTIDKVKDSVFKYIEKKAGDSNEIFEETMEQNNEKSSKSVLQEHREVRRQAWGRVGDINYETGLQNTHKSSIDERRFKEPKSNLGSLNLNKSQLIQKNTTNNSLPTKDWAKYVNENYKSSGTRTDLQDIKLPLSDKYKTSKKQESFYKDNYKKQNNSIVQQGESNKLPLGENTKTRKHYKSIMQSSYTSKEAKQISKKLLGIDTYIPESNKKQLERANDRIEIAGPDNELSSLMARASTGGNIKAEDIAVGERLIQYYSKLGDKVKLQESIQATAMAGTTAGQTVQAMSLLNHQTPEGQAVWIQRSVERMNNQLKKERGEKAQQFNLTEDMIKDIVGSENTEKLNENLNKVYKELGQQVSKTTLQKIDSWRYFSMLANPKTHIRNIVGNTVMGKTQLIKNKVAGSIEAIASKINPEIERNHTIVFSNKEIKQFAKEDIKNVADRLGLNENKYNPKSRLENSMRTFKNNKLENTIGKLFDLNDKLLEAEDGWGLKAGYIKALSEYMTANKLKPYNITDKQLAKARNYAVEQAQEATFHQVSSLATLLNQLQNKNKFAKFLGDSILPFKKTPINVAKSGLEYSPAGLVKSMIFDTVQLRKGNITVNKYIDNISKGLTGTGIAMVGYTLANAGILKASGSDDKDKEKYDENIGSQRYSIKIGNSTYSLDWLAPTGIPLFIGAECYELSKSDSITKTSSSDEDSRYNKMIQSSVNILNSFTNAINPMTEMSMLSGLTSALKSYDQDSSQMLASMGTNAIKSYVNQFIPTALGQIAKTTDEYERSTTSTKTGVLPRAIDTTKNQIMSKVPGLRQMLPIKTDIWGSELKQTENTALRGLENAILPWNNKDIETNKVDKALKELYNEIGESSILPNEINKKVTINGKDYRLTNEEYAKYKKEYGQNSYKLIENLVTSKNYGNLSNKQKQKAIEEIYSYIKENNKVDYAKKIKQEIEVSTQYKVLEDLKLKGGEQSEYLNYVARIEGIEKQKEKNKILSNSNYSQKTKSIIYKNTTGKEDELYNKILYKSSINIDEYLKYKLQEFESDKKEDGTIDGKAISGSKKKKVYGYVNSMKISKEQRLLLLGTQYKLDRDEQIQLYNYINNIKGQTQREKLDIFSKYNKNFTIYKNNTMSFK